jgi:PAS domain S-box-containing protein
MISGWGLLLVSLVYVGGLFAIAWWGDRSRLYPRNGRLRALIYSLALAVYCSSWTFYGAVGSAVRDGLTYLPIYLGPILLFTVGLPFFERLVRIAKQQNATSISDLLSARFRRSSRIAIIVTIVALTAAIPYIALQLKAVSMSIAVLTGKAATSTATVWYQDSTLFVALLLALFASLFGTREVDATEHHPGMVLAVAAESVVKLLALICVAIFALTQLDGVQPLLATMRSLPAGVDHSITFITQTLISLTAIFCLPRQFQIGVVECADPQDVRRARWWFPGYLAIVSILVVPIATAALIANSSGASIAPDSFVLWLPLSAGHEWLALLAYLGGFSAATGMVIVASVALATMVSNDLVLPALWRLRLLALGDRAAASGAILWIRRIAILGVLLAAYAFFRAVPEAPSLASIGLLAFAAVAQFSPALIASVYWPGASRSGVIAGLLSGFLLWIYTLLVPAIASANGAMPAWIVQGPFGIALLAPQALLGIEAPDALTHGVLWALLANVVALVGMSLRYPPAIAERLQAASYVSSIERPEALSAKLLPGTATLGDLDLLARRLLGAPAAQRLMERYTREQTRAVTPSQRADVGLLQALERELAGALGASSARMVLASALRGAGLKLSDVVALFDAASQKLRLNRELLEAMMDNMPQGISVADADMRLVAWNQHYLELFQYPPELVCVGRPVAELIRYNAVRGWCGPGEPEDHVYKRLDYMRAASPHISERRRADGRVIEMRGQPLPDGGFVTTFSDVTSHKRVEGELREINETLEERVAERTQQLAQATAAAEQANVSKTRFVAAASHDLLQPLNAARLFNAAVRGRSAHDPELSRLADRVDNSLQAAEELLDALLDVSRLDAGAVHPELATFPAGDLLASLHEQFVPIATQRGLELRVHPTQLHVYTDQRMLRRILQNFIGNALRYTRRGKIVIGCRRREHSDEVEFQVLDTGPGIALENQRTVFEEFRRLDQHSPWGEKGLGLGLSICERIARVLDAVLTLTSAPGRGSAFGVCVPRGRAMKQPPSVAAPVRMPSIGSLAGLRVLCVEDDPAILDGMRELLGRWEIQVLCATTPAEAHAAIALQEVDIVLADYHLEHKPLGLEVLDALVRGGASGRPRAGALVTADASGEVSQRARALGFEVLRKPVRPGALRALIAALARRPAAEVPQPVAGESL